MAFKGGVILGPISFNDTGAATTSVGGTTSTGAINIGTSTGDQTIHVGFGAANKTIVLGVANGTTSVDIESGSGGATVNSVGGTTTLAGSAGITVNSGSGNIGIGNQADPHNINIGTGASARTITIGNITTTTGVNVNTGTSGITMATTTTGPIAINPGTTGAVTLGTTSTGNVSIGNTTGTTSIQFGTGSALSTFVDWTSWTPTLVGASTAGSTTYTNQDGIYSRIGNIVHIQFRLVISAMTGTGDMLIGGLPFTVNNSNASIAAGAIVFIGTIAWPTGASSIAIYPINGSTTAKIYGSGNFGPGGIMQMSNAALTAYGSLIYRV